MAEVGYARVSTTDQDPQMQLDALATTGVIRTFTDTASGARADRPNLAMALDHLRDHSGDVLVVWRLDRLGRSLRDLINLVDGLHERGIGFRSLTESIDTTTPGGKLIFPVYQDELTVAST